MSRGVRSSRATAAWSAPHRTSNYSHRGDDCCAWVVRRRNRSIAIYESCVVVPESLARRLVNPEYRSRSDSCVRPFSDVDWYDSNARMRRDHKQFARVVHLTSTLNHTLPSASLSFFMRTLHPLSVSDTLGDTSETAVTGSLIFAKPFVGSPSGLIPLRQTSHSSKSAHGHLLRSWSRRLYTTRLGSGRSSPSVGPLRRLGKEDESIPVGIPQPP